MPQERVPTLDEAGVLLGKFLPGYLDEVALNATIDSRTAASVAAADADRVAAQTAQAAAAASAAQAATSASGATTVAVAGAMPLLYTNFITNPSFEVDTAGWAFGANSTIARSTADKYLGGASLLPTQIAAATTNVHTSTTVTGLVVGLTYTLSSWVRRNSGTVGITMQAGPAGAVQTGAFAASPDAWTRLVVTFTATATTVVVYWYPSTSNMTASVAGNGASFYIDAVTLTPTGFAPDYFDGSTAGCRWTGTAHASTSERYAVPPNGFKEIARNGILAENLVLNPGPCS